MRKLLFFKPEFIILIANKRYGSYVKIQIFSSISQYQIIPARAKKKTEGHGERKNLPILP